MSSRVKGLDSLRFILAAIVVLSHIGHFPLLEGIDTSTRVGWLLRGFYNASLNGPAAVIVFFVISGFCIHYPYRHGEPLRLLQYYPRRYLRILLPLAGSIGIGILADLPLSSLEYTYLWSIVCEEIYYLLYPLLLLWRRQQGWGILLVLAFLAAMVVAWTNPKELNYYAYGWRLNWLLGLPCWLLGCKLAERSDVLHKPVSKRTLWSWRFLVWFTSGVFLGLRHHSPIGYPHTLNYVAVLSYFWLQQEIQHFREVEPPRLLEWAGKWSYSLYLLHVPANFIYVTRFAIANLGFILNWLLRFGWTLGCSYTFYLVVEKPSHALARWLGKREQGPLFKALPQQTSY